MKKKFVLSSLMFVFGMFIMPNVYATEANDTDSLSRLLEENEPTIELKSDGDYTGDFTINHDVTIVGNGATIKGTFAIEGGTNINISNLTMTDGTPNNQAKPEYISVQSSNVKLNVSKVKIYYGDMDNSSEFIKHGTGIVVYAPDGDGSTVEVTDSTIHTKYAIWIEGSNSNLTVKNSNLAGYAALDLTSSGSKTSNNNITIDNSTLTGYAIGYSKDGNNYGTIAIANKDNVTIDIINNSVITNNFANGNDARSDLILISNAYTLPKNVKVNVSNSTLKNTASNINLGAVYNANGTSDNSFKTKNTTIIGNLIAGENGQFYYVDFVVDGKSNVVLVDENGHINPSDIPNVDKAGYAFDGWFDENGKRFDTTKNVTRNLIVNARFTKVTSAEKIDDTKNPDTSDVNLLMLISLITLSGLGLGYTIKKRRFN